MALTLDGTAGITFPSGSGTQAAQSKVLQVVNATYSTISTNATSTFADTGLTASITPLFSTSKILVLINQAGVGKLTGDTGCMMRLLRNGSSILVINDILGLNGSTASNRGQDASTSYLDSPATTSAVTYKTQFASYANIAAAYVQDAGSGTATSTITLMEIAA